MLIVYMIIFLKNGRNMVFWSEDLSPFGLYKNDPLIPVQPAHPATSSLFRDYIIYVY